MGWKLVRDRNEQWCRANGVSGQWRTSPAPVTSLRRKVFEEAAEYAEQHDVSELYDLLDVVLVLLKLEDPHDEAYRAHAAKTDELGGFGEFIEWTPVPAGAKDWSPDGQ